MTKEEAIIFFNQYNLKYNKNSGCNCNQHVECITQDGYYVMVSKENLLKGCKPIIVASSNPKSIQNIELFLQKNNYKTKLLQGQTYINNVQKLKLVCECGREFCMSWNSLRLGCGIRCNVCNRQLQSQEQSLKKNDIECRFSDKNFKVLDNIETKYENQNSKLKVIDKNGYMYDMSIGNLQHRNENSKGKFSKNNNYVVHNLNVYCKHNMWSCKVLNLDKEKELLNIRCECGEVYQTKLYHFVKGQPRCSKCSHKISQLEIVIKDFLKSHNIDFIQQYKFSDCKDKRSLPFDFYLPKYNCCIEVDGRQHEQPVYFSGNNDEALQNFKLTKKHDNIKNKYCKKHNILLLRISENEIRNQQYEEIILSKLNIR